MEITKENIQQSLIEYERFLRFQFVRSKNDENFELEEFICKGSITLKKIFEEEETRIEIKSLAHRFLKEMDLIHNYYIGTHVLFHETLVCSLSSITNLITIRLKFLNWLIKKL